MQSANQSFKLKQSQGVCQTKREGDGTESSLESKRKKLLRTFVFFLLLSKPSFNHQGLKEMDVAISCTF